MKPRNHLLCTVCGVVVAARVTDFSFKIQHQISKTRLHFRSSDDKHAEILELISSSSVESLSQSKTTSTHTHIEYEGDPQTQSLPSHSPQERTDSIKASSSRFSLVVISEQPFISPNHHIYISFCQFIKTLLVRVQQEKGQHRH